jgi:hypothetical protein
MLTITGTSASYNCINNLRLDGRCPVASFFSWQQIEHFTGRKTGHIAEILAGRIAPGHVWKAPVLPTPESVDVEPTPEVVVHEENVGEGPA